MSEFGRLLRYLRREARDPERGGTLTQERLGEFIGRQLGDLGYTGAAISHWERGQSSPSQKERNVLLALIQALMACGAIHSREQADQLLAAGDYRELDETEIETLNPEWATASTRPAVPPPSAPERNWQRLYRYLPDTLYREVELAPRDEWETLSLNHLKKLLETVITYVPRHLAMELLERPRPPAQQNRGAFQDGTLLFADISGFTDLSEVLRRLGGKEGAEEVVRIINGYLDVMLGVLFKHDGRLIKFGGDAMLCLYPGDKAGAMKAVWTAWEMKQAMLAHFAEIEAFQELFPLSMKVGNNSGLLFAAMAGDEEHMEYILTGSAVEGTAQAESAASRGDIVVSGETYEHIKEAFEVEPLPDKEGYYRVMGVPPDPALTAADPWTAIEDWLWRRDLGLWELLDRLDALVPYLPAGVLPQLVYDPGQGHLTGQHRRVTVLFANFVGMSEVIEAYGVDDPENVAAVINEYFRSMQDEVNYYGGTTNKVDLYDQGDKLMIVFGAPVAHERDARRAALTALAMQEAMSRLSAPVAAALLSQRIGIHSGFVFAGNVGSDTHHRREYTVMGDTVNLAARLMGRAGPGEILLSPEVWSEIGEEFQGLKQEAAPMKGISQPMPAFQLLNMRPGLRHDRPLRTLRSEIVGRQGELEQLAKMVDGLLFGEGKRIVAITGEGGVGKTRLIGEWQQQVELLIQASPPLKWLTGFGRSYGQRAHGVFIDLLEQLCGFEDRDQASDRWNKLARKLQASLVESDPDWVIAYTDRLAYLGHFLGLELGLRQGLTERVALLDGEALQLQTWLALSDLLNFEAQQQPLILILEDLHWADSASLEMLRFLVDQLSDDIPILFCLIFRSQKEQRIWQTWQEIGRSYPSCEEIKLRELEEQMGQRLLGNLLHTDQPLPPALVKLVQYETDGNPLYMEEVLYSLIDAGILVRDNEQWQLSQAVERVRVPDTLYQIIQSRIDDLDYGSPGARRVLWLAAVLGWEFTEEVLRHLFERSGRTQPEFMRHLRELRNADMIERTRLMTTQGQIPGFKFRHGLVQQVAYENMPVRSRRQYHLYVAEWLESIHRESLSPHYDALAYHYDQAGVAEQAFHYHFLVGRRDARLYANESALAHLQRALILAGSLELPAAQLGQLRFELGQVLATTGQFSQALAELEQASQQFSQAGEEGIRQRARAAYEIGRIHELQGSPEAAWQWRQRGLEGLPPAATAEGALLHALGGIISLRQGSWEGVGEGGRAALAQAEAAGAAAEQDVAHRLLSVYWRVQGDLAQAMTHCQAGIDIAQAHADLRGLIKGYSNQGVIAFEMDDWPQAQSAYQRALSLLERAADRYELGRAYCNLADLYFHQGDLEPGFSHARQGLEIALALEAAQEIIVARVILAALHWRRAEFEPALAQLAEAEGLAQEAVMWQPTVGRWQLQLYLDQGELAQAKAIMDRLLALEVDVLADELEPIQRLHGQLLAAQGKPDEAIPLLRASLERTEAAGMAYQAALTRLALAQVLWPADEAAAREAASQAQQTFERLGARSDLEVAQRLLAA